MRRAACLSLVLVSGCTRDVVDFVAREQTDIWMQAPTDQVDILFVVDSSGSMKEEQDLLSSGFASFVEGLQSSENPVDFHIGVIDTDFDVTTPTRGKLLGTPAYLRETDDYIGLFQSRVIVGTSGSGLEKGLEAALYALSPVMTTDTNEGFLRDDANLLVVFVSDEDDCSDNGRFGTGGDELNLLCYSEREKLTPVPGLVAEFQALKANRDMVKLAAIVGPEETASATCDQISLPGRRYIEAARLTGGLTSSICDSDWGSFLEELGLQATGIFTSFQLEHGAIPGTLVVTIDGEPVPFLGYVGAELDDEHEPAITRAEAAVAEGYVYDVDTLTIEFFNSWVPDRGAEIKASYTILPGT